MVNCSIQFHAICYDLKEISRSKVIFELIEKEHMTPSNSYKLDIFLLPLFHLFIRYIIDYYKYKINEKLHL